MRISECLKTITGPAQKRCEELFSSFPADAGVALLRVAAGEAVIRQEEPCRAVYALLEGRARTLIQQQGSSVHAFEDFSAVDFFGEHEVLAAQPLFLANVVARTDCTFLVIPAADYLRWMLGDSEAFLARTRSILQTLLRQTAQERSSLYMTGADRLAKFLVDYCDRHGSEGTGSVTVAHTHASISEEIGFTVRTVNRAICALKEKDEVGLHKGKITISDLQQERLRAHIAAL